MNIDVARMAEIINTQGASCGVFELDGEPAVVAVWLPVSCLEEGNALVERLNRKLIAKYKPGQAVLTVKPQRGIIGPPFEWLPATVVAKTGRDDFACADYYKLRLESGEEIETTENAMRPVEASA